MITSALSAAQSKQVAAIQSLPKEQQKDAARALIERTFNIGAVHSIKCIFDL